MIPLENRLYEGSQYVGIIIYSIIYGIYLGIYCLSTLSLLTNTNTTRAQRAPYITYGSVLFVLNTLNFVGQAHVSQMMWITDRDKSISDMIGYYNMQDNTSPLMILGGQAQSIAAFLADTFLIYRCYIVFSSRLYVILLPALCTIGSIALSIAYAPIAYNSNDMQIHWLTVTRAMIASIILTTAANIMATGMICFKILSVLYSVQRSGCIDSRMKKTYTNIVALLVESAAPSAILGIITSVFQTSPPLSNPDLTGIGVFLVWSSIVALFPQLIIFRIAQGTAWTKTTSQELTQVTGPVAFAPRENINSTSPSMQISSVHDECTGLSITQNF